MRYTRVYSDAGAAGTSGFTEDALSPYQAIDSHGILLIPADTTNFRTNVGIRTFWWDEGRWHLGTGGGVTWDSTAAGEWEETELKARRLLAVARGLR